MTQMAIVSGIYTDQSSDIKVSYPRNMFVIPGETGISGGYLRPADGIVQFATGQGLDRGGINWNGICYRVMGNGFVSVNADGSITNIGDVGPGGQCTFDYSFDRLGISSGGRLYYYYGGVLIQMVDPDLLNVVDFTYVDGYFMTTDGSYLIVTDLGNPLSINPLKYGSSEIDPDPIKGLLTIKNEVYAFNRHTVEVFRNVGGTLFPFQRIEGAVIQRGAVGTYCATVFGGGIAFMGSARNEPISVWLGLGGTIDNISTRSIDQILASYTEMVLSEVIIEARVISGQSLLYIHLPDKTLVYDVQASRKFEKPIWVILDSSSSPVPATYMARNFVYCYNRTLAGNNVNANIGYLSTTVSSHYGVTIPWEFATSIIYNESKSAIFSELELVCISGRTLTSVNPTIWTSYTTDGVTFSQEKPVRLGKYGETAKRITWFNQGFMRNWRCQKFRGDSDSLLSVARLEMTIT